MEHCNYATIALSVGFLILLPTGQGFS